MEDERACPYHAARAQKLALQERFGDAVLEDGFPFAPMGDGSTVKKELMVSAIQRCAVHAGRRIKDEDDHNVITGHVFRISGTRHTIRAGVAVPPIMFLARWDSHCVLRYAKDAPLKNITAEYKRGLRQEKLKELGGTTHTVVKNMSDAVTKILKQMEEEVVKHDDELEAMHKKLAILDSKVSPKYIISDQYKTWHITQKWQDVPAAGWRALCGWRYGKSVFERLKAGRS